MTEIITNKEEIKVAVKQLEKKLKVLFLEINTLVVEAEEKLNIKIEVGITCSVKEIEEKVKPERKELGNNNRYDPR